MRRGTLLRLVRFLCAFALLTAYWVEPAKASGAAPTMASCGMPCCQPKVVSTPTLAPPPCGCELKSTPAHPVVADTVALPQVPVAPIAILAARPTFWIPQALRQTEPGLIGTDSSPPPRVTLQAVLGRAPPFVCA